MPGLTRHPVMKTLYKDTGFPFGYAQGGEHVEPRVKPGMTKLDLYFRKKNKRIVAIPWNFVQSLRITLSFNIYSELETIK